MPIYAYECECGKQFSEVFLTAQSAEANEDGMKCPYCGRDATRLLSATAVRFVGSGWQTPQAQASGSDFKDMVI